MTQKQAYEFADGVNQMGEDVNELKENLSELAHDAASTAMAGANEVKQGIKRSVDAGRKGAAEALEGVSDHISENPLRSVAIAVGVGFALGALLCRRK